MLRRCPHRILSLLLLHCFSAQQLWRNRCLFVSSVDGPPARNFLQVLCQQGQLDRALDVLVRMDQPPLQRTTLAPSLNHMFVLLLNECATRRALPQAKLVCAHLTKHTTLNNAPAAAPAAAATFLGDCMVRTLVKCGGLQDALHLFHTLPHPTVRSWSALISGYTLAGQERDSINLYVSMRRTGLEPNKFTIVAIGRACGNLADLVQGKRVAADARQYNCLSDPYVGACLVDMFVKCGSLADAQDVFDGLPHKNVVAWTAVITAYAHHGQPHKALDLFVQMQVQGQGVSPDARAFACAAQACSLVAQDEQHAVLEDGTRLKLASLQRGKSLHASARTRGGGSHSESDVFVANTLITMYGKCGGIVEAYQLFTSLPHRDVVSWNAMLAAYAHQSQPHKVLLLYEDMLLESSTSPNERTFVTLLQACGLVAEEKGREAGHGRPLLCPLYTGKVAHADAWRRGYCGADLFIASVLVSMYGKCGSLADAHNVFHTAPRRTTVLWNALLAAYVELDHADGALQMYAQMREEDTSPDDRTVVTLLQACCTLAQVEQPIATDTYDGGLVEAAFLRIGSLQKGKAVHALARRSGYYGSDTFVNSTLITFYGKCGSTLDAEAVFNHLPSSHSHNVVECNTMLAAYASQGQAANTFLLYQRMLDCCITPDDITHAIVLQSCGNAGSLSMCKHVHDTLLRSGGGKVSAFLATALIHAYGRCASMSEARTVFDALAMPDVVAWNALIAGYARQGDCAGSLQCYAEMQSAGTRPDVVTFLALLSSCSHAGLVDKGVDCFDRMTTDHGLSPGMEHYVCMVDLLGRAGQLSAVADLVSSMPLPSNMSIWISVLAACRQHGDVLLGQQAFQSAISLDPKDPSPYILMSNIYADAGLWECAQGVTQSGRKWGAWKNLPGQSWIEHEQDVRGYIAADLKHPEVFSLLNSLNSRLCDCGVGS